MATLTMTATTPQSTQKEINPSYIPRGTVTASLKFFDAPIDGSKPFSYPPNIDPPEGIPRSNFGDTDISVLISDIRDQESCYNIDDNGFTTLQTAPSTTDIDIDFTCNESIEQKYYPEISATLSKTFPEATRILVFDHTVRPQGGHRPPVLRVHIDQSRSATIKLIRTLLPDSADTLLLLHQSRFRIINVWRPLNGPVQSHPLAFADSQTVQDVNLYVVEHRFAERTVETMALAHADERWCYWSGMQDSERLLIQCFDSEKGARCVHAAFVDSRTPLGARERESIEVRALVFG